MSKFAKLSLSAFAVAVVGMLASSCLVVTEDEGQAEVKFTWDAYSPGYEIQYIRVSYEDVKRWYDYIYNVVGYVEDDATDVPLYGGSYDIPYTIYSIDLPQYATKYKGVYQAISKGNYTAVCTVKDRSLDNTFDIVANYKIRVGEPGTTKYYEVAFDVKKFLAGENDLGYSFYEYNRPEN